jgi:hypothetical protein
MSELILALYQCKLYWGLRNSGKEIPGGVIIEYNRCSDIILKAMAKIDSTAFQEVVDLTEEGEISS